MSFPPFDAKRAKMFPMEILNLKIHHRKWNEDVSGRSRCQNFRKNVAFQKNAEREKKYFSLML